MAALFVSPLAVIYALLFFNSPRYNSKRVSPLARHECFWTAFSLLFSDSSSIMGVLVASMAILTARSDALP